VGRKQVKEEKQQSGARGSCNKVEHEGEVKEEGEVMFGGGEGGGGADAMEWRQLALWLLFCVRAPEARLACMAAPPEKSSDM
jgi:hypothetical protein